MFYAVIGAYVLTSYFFLKFPLTLHRRKNVKFLAKHISHRGGAGECYENTLYTFQRAVDMGTQLLELDCQITKDEQVVVCHDDNLERLTGVKALVSETNYKDLPCVMERVPIDFNRGHYFCDKTIPAEERRIPLLKEVFEKFPTIPVNIDIKKNDDKLIEGVSQLITKYQREELCVWGNVTKEITEKCYAKNPKVNLLFSRERVWFLVLCYYSGLLPFMPLKETHLEIFLPSIYLEKVKTRNYPTINKIMLYVMETLLIRKSLFTHLQKRGIRIYLWVLNSELEMERGFKSGADGVMTDYPTKLMDFLKERNMNSE